MERKLVWKAMVVGTVCGVPLLCGTAYGAEEGSLQAEIAKLTIPPPWFEEVTVNYDLAKPWKDARLHIRKLLSQRKEREAIKMTYIYHHENRGSKDGHEYPMYLFLGGEYAWAAKEYRERVDQKPKGHTGEYLSMASLYTRFGEHQKALDVLATGLERLPDPPWRVFNMAKVHASFGDVYADLGKVAEAKASYQKAIELFGKAKPRYGRHLLPRHISKVQARLDLLTRKTFDLSQVRDGVYRGQSLGYGKPVTATVTVKKGRIANIRLSHQEKIEQGATKIVPKQIIARQSLDVDAITGATVTVQAIVEAVYRALARAGAK